MKLLISILCIKKKDNYAYVFTKKKTNKTDEFIKDGFHIMFPTIILNTNNKNDECVPDFLKHPSGVSTKWYVEVIFKPG